MSIDNILDQYSRPGPMTATGEHNGVFEALPDDVEVLAGVVQGVLLHEHWAPTYGQILSDERRRDTHLRPAGGMLAQIFTVDDRPLHEARPLESRIVGTCRNFSVMMVAMLRAKGVPARARCGFATYFVDGKYVDHWVAEYWNHAETRWKMVDAQLDDFQRQRLALDFDVLDVPRDRFLVAGDAWARCRTGKADPADFGILDMHGYWFIAGNIMRDLAALNNVEMLPWDDWGSMPRPGEKIDDDQLRVFDDLAEITRHPDENYCAIRDTYAREAFRVPPVVYNAVLNRPENVL